MFMHIFFLTPTNPPASEMHLSVCCWWTHFKGHYNEAKQLSNCDPARWFCLNKSPTSEKPTLATAWALRVLRSPAGSRRTAETSERKQQTPGEKKKSPLLFKEVVPCCHSNPKSNAPCVKSANAYMVSTDLRLGAVKQPSPHKPRRWGGGVHLNKSLLAPAGRTHISLSHLRNSLAYQVDRKGDIMRD